MTGPGPAQRTYGNWRQRRGLGLGGLTPTQTWLVCVAVGVPLATLLVSAVAALATLPATVVLLVAALARWDGVPIADAARARVRWAGARARGWTRYRAGVLVEHSRRADLPGVLAPLALLDVEDGRGGRQGMVWDRRTGTLTTVLQVASVGTMLADASDVDAWVASWGQWLADLGYLPAVRWVTVTVETSPSPGTGLADYVAERISPTAPPAARAIVADLVAATPRAAADIDTRIALTLDPARMEPRPDGLLDSAAEATRIVAGLETGLGACGVAVVGRAGAGRIAGAVRAAFDPAARAEVTRMGDNAHVLAWADAGPVAAAESWGHYRHDSGRSVAFALHEAPRQAVTSHVLAPLLAPGPYARRVTVTYQPFPAEAAVAQVQRELQAATIRRAYRRRTQRDDSARDVADESRAHRAAMEEAEGAGVELVTLFVTTTVADPDDLPDAAADVEQRARLVDQRLAAAAADVEHRAGAARLRLRRMYGAQAVGFAATLGLGCYPPDLARRRRRTR